MSAGQVVTQFLVLPSAGIDIAESHCVWYSLSTFVVFDFNGNGPTLGKGGCVVHRTGHCIYLTGVDGETFIISSVLVML